MHTIQTERSTVRFSGAQLVEHLSNMMNLVCSFLLLVIAAGLISSCSSSTSYTRELPVLRVNDPKKWNVVDSLILLNRSCDRFDRGRRVVWLMSWERTGLETYTIKLTKDRIVPDGTFGCVFVEGEPVILVGDSAKGMCKLTESRLTLVLDNYEADYTESFSLWMLKNINDQFNIVESYPMPCWKMRDPPVD